MRHMANTKAAMATVAAMCAVVGVLGGIGMAQGPATSHPATAPAPPTAALPATSSAVMLEKGIYTEETVGDLDAAMKIYRQIVEDAKAARKYAAQAQYRLGMCHLKKGDKAKATAELRELLALYPQEKEIAAQAQKELAKLEPLEEEITKLRRRGTTTEDVIRVLGEPEKLIWGRQTFTKDNLPETYILQYPKGLHVMVSYGLAVEFRSEQPGPGFTYRGKLRLGSPLKDVLDVLGEPSHTVVGEPIGFVRDWLYKDIDGRKGYSYYSRADHGVRVFLVNGNVCALYLTTEGNLQDFLPAAKAAPLVVKTTPAALADNVDPSLGKMTVTFDRPMIDKSWSWTGGGETYPEAAGEISYDAARTTCTMPVKLQPGKVYWVGVNSPSHKNFKSADGTPAARYVILFATRSAGGKATPLPDDLVKRAIGINPADQDNVAGARSVAEEFLAAMKAGDTSKALRLVTAASATGHQLSDFAKILALSKVVITGDFEDANSALVITSDVLGDHDRKGPLLIRLVKQRGLWGVEDIDLESPEGALKKLEGFLTGADALAAPYAIAKAFVSALSKGDANSALILVGKEFDERKKQELPQVAKGMDLSNSGPMMMALYSSSARMVFGPASVKSNGARSFLCLTLIQNAPGTEAWSVIDADFVDKQKSAESFMSAPSSQASTADKEARKAKLINWVEKFFSENYRDITARKTLQWGEPETTAGGNLAIRYKYLATIWDKDKQIIEQRFTFTPEGKYVSAETIEKSPATPEVIAQLARQREQIVVEDLAIQILAAIRDKDDAALKALATNRIKDWPGALPKFALEMRERFLQKTGKPFQMSAGQSMVLGSAAVVKCTGPVELDGVYLALFFVKTADGWKNFSLRNSPASGSLETLLRNAAKEIGLTDLPNSAEAVTTVPSDADRQAAEDLSAEGWALWNQRKLPEAEAKFKASVAKDPANANAWNGLGWAQQNQGKPANAKDAFEKAVAADPKLAGALNGLGWVAISQGKTEDAVEYWKKAIAAAPATTAALNGLAMTYANLGEFGKAIEAYQQWLKVEPENKDAKAGLEKAKQDDKALLAGAESWLGLLDRGEYVKAWEQAGPMLRTIVDDKNMFATVTKAVRDDMGKVKSRKQESRQLMTSIPGMIGGPFQVLRYDTQFEKKHMNENVIMQKDRLGTWGVVGYTVAPYSMTMSGVLTGTTANEKDVPKEATAAAEQWLGLVDAGKYAESWDQAAEMFQKGVAKQEWQRMVDNARSPLGKLKARKFLNVAYISSKPNGPVDKDAVMIQFDSSFEKRDKAVETVSLMKGKDGKWQVAGYFIK